MFGWDVTIRYATLMVGERGFIILPFQLQDTLRGVTNTIFMMGHIVHFQLDTCMCFGRIGGVVNVCLIVNCE